MPRSEDDEIIEVDKDGKPINPTPAAVPEETSVQIPLNLWNLQEELLKQVLGNMTTKKEVEAGQKLLEESLKQMQETNELLKETNKYLKETKSSIDSLRWEVSKYEMDNSEKLDEIKESVKTALAKVPQSLMSSGEGAQSSTSQPSLLNFNNTGKTNTSSPLSSIRSAQFKSFGFPNSPQVFNPVPFPSTSSFIPPPRHSSGDVNDARELAEIRKIERRRRVMKSFNLMDAKKSKIAETPPGTTLPPLLPPPPPPPPTLAPPPPPPSELPPNST